MTDASILLLIPAFALLLTGLAAALRLVELAFPAVSGWLDEHVGEPRGFEE